MSRHIDTFLDMMAAERGASSHTLDAYKRDLKHFADFQGQDVSRAQSDDVRSYLEHLHAEGLSPRDHSPALVLFASILPVSFS